MGNKNSSLKIIVLVGPAGCGKSRFIQCLVPKDQQRGVPVNHKLGHEPRPVQAFRIQDPPNVLLVDTPGFDTERQNMPEDVSEAVRAWMNRKHPKTAVTAILCLHRITDNRLTERPPANLLKKACGNDAQVVLVTTHWDMMKRKVKKGVETEEQLKKGPWASLLAQDARVERFDNTTAKAQEIIGQLVAKG